MGERLNNHDYVENYYIRTGISTVIGCRHCPWASSADTSEVQGWPWVLYQSAQAHKECLNSNDIGLLVTYCKCEGYRQGHWNTCQQDLTLQVYALSAGKTTNSKKLRTESCGIFAIDVGSLKKPARTSPAFSKITGRTSQRRVVASERDSRG
jgi:hypothetical protein